jgi:hypothetical protein
LSCANDVCSEDNTVLGCEEINMLVTVMLQMNREFMESLRLNYASASSAQLHNMTLVQLYSRFFTSVVNTPVGSFLSNLIEKLARRRDTGFAAGYEK